MLLCTAHLSDLPAAPAWPAADGSTTSSVSAAASSVDIVWANRGTFSGTNDNGFDDVFGTSAAAAQLVVDAAIAAWEQVITSFNRADGTNDLQVNISMNMAATNSTGFGGSGAPASTAPADGKPRSGSISINRGNLDGDPNNSNGWYLDPSPFNYGEFDGNILNPFAGVPSSPTPLGADLFSLVTAELTHCLGLISTKAGPGGGGWTGYLFNNSPYLTATGRRDNAEGGGSSGYFYTFTGPTVSHLMTSFNSGDTDDDSWGNPIHTAGGAANETISSVNYRGTEDDGNARYNNERTLPSYVTAHILSDTYGYSIENPAKFGTFYSRLDTADGVLHISGLDNSNDFIRLRRVDNGLFVDIDLQNDVPGSGSAAGAFNYGIWTSEYSISQIQGIQITTGSGDDWISFTSLASSIPITVNGGSGTDTIEVTGTTGNENFSATSTSVTGPNLSVAYSNVNAFEFDCNGGVDNLSIGRDSNVTTLRVNGTGGADTINLNALSSGFTSVQVNAFDGADTINLGSGTSGSIASATTVFASNGNDTINLGSGGDGNEIAAAVTVNGSNGDDTLNLAPNSQFGIAVVNAPVTFNADVDNDTLVIGSGGLDAVTALVTYNAGAFGDDRLILNDTDSFFAYHYNIGLSSIIRDPRFAGVNFNDSEEVTLNCSNGHNSVVIPPGLTYELVVNGNDGNDNFTIGGGTLDFEGAQQTLNGGNGTDQITYDNHLDTVGRFWEIHPTEIIVQLQFSRLHLGNAGFEAMGLLAGNDNDLFQFYGEITKSVVIDAGAGNDTFDTLASRGWSINCIGGAGHDYLDVDDRGIPANIDENYVYADHITRHNATSGVNYNAAFSGMEAMDFHLSNAQNYTEIHGVPNTIAAGFSLVVWGGTTSDFFNLYPHDGAGNLAFGANLVINSGAGVDNVVFQDGAHTDNVTVTWTNLFGTSSHVQGIGAGYVSVSNDTEAQTFNAGIGHDVFFITKYISGTGLAINAGDGHDQLFFGNGSLPLDVTSMSSFNFNGQAGTDSFTLNNINDVNPWRYENNATNIRVDRLSGGAYFVQLNYAGLESLTVEAGPGNDTLNLFALTAGQGLRFNPHAGTNGMNLIDTPAIRGPIFYDDGNSGGVNNINKLTVSTSPITLHVEQNSIGAHPSDTFFGPGGSLSFNAVTNISLTTGSGNDVVYAKPSPFAAITLRGGNPTSAPGDTIHLALANASNYSIGPGPFGVGFRVTSTNNQPLDYSDFETVNTDAVAPQITARSFNPTAGSQSVSFTFDQDVSASLNASSLQVTNIDPAMMAYSYAGNTATWTFPGLAGVLPSRLYTATVVGATDPAGNGATGTPSWQFLWVNGTAANDTFRVKRGTTSGFLEVFINGAPTPSFNVKPSNMNQFNLGSGDGNDVVIVDHTGNGRPPIPLGPAPYFAGGDGSGGDQLVLVGTSGNNAATFDAASAALDAGAAFTHAGFETTGYQSAGGADTVVVNAGTLRFTSSESLSALSIAAGASTVLHPGADKVLVVNTLAIAQTGLLDITDNDVIIDYSGATPFANIEADVRSGYNVVGDWLGDGITSSIAAVDGGFTVAIADNSALAAPFGSTAGGPLFAGVDVDLDAVLIKFTHRADINLDGAITPDDAAIFGTNYSENDFATWAIGDVDYDGLFTPNDAAIFGTFYDESLPVV